MNTKNKPLNSTLLSLSSVIGKPVHNPAGDALGTIVDVLYDSPRRELHAALLHAADESLHHIHPDSLHLDRQTGRFLLDALPGDFTEATVGEARWQKPAPATLGHPTFFFDTDITSDYAAAAPATALPDAPPPAQRHWYPGDKAHTERDTRRGGVMRALPTELASTTS